MIYFQLKINITHQISNYGYPGELKFLFFTEVCLQIWSNNGCQNNIVDLYIYEKPNSLKYNNKLKLTRFYYEQLFISIDYKNVFIKNECM